MLQVLGTPAGLPVNRDGAQGYRFLRRHFPVDPLAQDINCFPGGPVDRPADGCQPAHDRLPQGVKTGHRHILRHPDALLIQAFDHAQRHVVVRADNRVRQFPAVLQDLFRGFSSADAGPFPVKNQAAVQLQPVLRHGPPAGFQTRSRHAGVQRTADKDHLPDAVLGDQVLCQFLDADRVVKCNTYSAFLGHVDGYVRFPCFFNRLENFIHFMQRNVIPHGSRHGDDAVKLGQVGQVIDHAFPHFARGRNGNIHMALCIENTDVHIPVRAGGRQPGHKVLLIFAVNAGDQHCDLFTAHP